MTITTNPTANTTANTGPSTAPACRSPQAIAPQTLRYTFRVSRNGHAVGSVLAFGSNIVEAVLDASRYLLDGERLGELLDA